MTYLTEKQRDVLEFIRGRIEDRGVAPTLQEIATAFGFRSTASAQKHVGLLERKGFLKREKHQKRGLVLADRQQSSGGDRLQLPLLGVVAAGSPIESVADPENVSVPVDFSGPGRRFVLRVRGDSMVDEGIFDGDLVVVRSTANADDGDMVVAMVAGEVTLKRLYREPEGLLRLQPSNADLSPMIVPADDVTVQGTVVGLLRHY
jgi:repressor LexA